MEFTEQVFIAIIGAGQAITLGLIGVVGTVLMNGKRKHSATLAEVKDQVANHHDTNLRDDVTDISNAVSHLTREIPAIKNEVQAVRAELQLERRSNLEDTANWRSIHEDLSRRMTTVERFLFPKRKDDSQ